MPPTPEDRKRWFVRDLVALCEEHTLGLIADDGKLIIVPWDHDSKDTLKHIEWRA